MNILLWVLQGVLALLFLSGGAYKVLQFDQLPNYMRNLSRGGVGAIGVLEVVGAILLIVPAATTWMPGLTPLAAAVLAVESMALAGITARRAFSLRLTAANPLVWNVGMALLAVVVAYGRYAVSPLS